MRMSYFFAPLLVSVSTAFGNVLVVDDSGGAPYFTIQSAVDAAIDGDTILIKDGHYSDALSINGKALTVVAEKGATVTISPFVFGEKKPAFVENLPAGKTVVMRGLKVPLEIWNCAGFVRLEDCTFLGYGGLPIAGFGPCNTPKQVPGLMVQGSHRVSATRCTLAGGNGNYFLLSFTIGCCSYPSSGLSAVDSTISLFHCTVTGGVGSSECPGGTAAAPAITAQNSTVLAFDDSNLGPRTLSGSSPLRRNELGFITIGGVPGDNVLLLLSTLPAYQSIPGATGTLLLGPSFNGVFVLGTLASPSLSIPVAFSDIPTPGVPAFDLTLQAAYIDSTADVFIGHLTVMTMLDPSF